MKTVILTLYLGLAVTSLSFAAVDTAVVYKSGVLVSIFVGICGLIVVVQLVPALMLLMGFIKALMFRKEKATAAKSTQNGN